MGHPNAPVTDGEWQPDHVDQVLPWFASHCPLWCQFQTLSAWPTLEQIHAAIASSHICNGQGRPLQFIKSPPKRYLRKHKQSLPSYNARIHNDAEVLTRYQNWHDLFNLLIWSNLPRTKAQLHARQFSIECETQTLSRTPEQDALTRLDEGGALFLCDARDFPLLLAPSTRSLLWAWWMRSYDQRSVHAAELTAPSTTSPKDLWQQTCHTAFTELQALLQNAHPSARTAPYDALQSLHHWHPEDGIAAWEDIASDRIFDRMRIALVGHGLFEVMLAGGWDVTAMAWLLPLPTDQFIEGWEPQRQECDAIAALGIQHTIDPATPQLFGIPLGVLATLLAAQHPQMAPSRV